MNKAALIGYDGANMPFIFFKNRINALMDSCPFEGARLTLLQAACARTASQTIANLTSDTRGLSEKDRIEVSLEGCHSDLVSVAGFSWSLKLGSIAMVINWSLRLRIL